MGSGVPSKPNQSHVVSKLLQTFPARQAGPEPAPGSVKRPEQQNHTSHPAEELRPPGLSPLKVQQNHLSHSVEELKPPAPSPLQEQLPAWAPNPAQRPLQAPHRTHSEGAQRPFEVPQPTNCGGAQRGLQLPQPTNDGGALRKPPISDARPASLPAVQKTHCAVRSIPQSWAATPASEPGFAPAGGRPQSTSTEGPVPACAALRRVTHLAAPIPHGASGAEDSNWEHADILGTFPGQEAEEQLDLGTSRHLPAVPSGQEAEEQLAYGVSRHLTGVTSGQEAEEKLTPGTSRQLAVNKWKKRPLHDVVPVPPSGRHSNKQGKTESVAISGSGGTCSASGIRFPSARECAQPAERCVVVPDSFSGLEAYKECWQRAIVEELNLRSAAVNSIIIAVIMSRLAS
jgi:hypothetical protein